MSNPAQFFSQLIFGNESLARRLETSSLVQSVARHLQLRRWINGALARRPLRRHLSSGVQYQLETFEAVAVEKMYFGNPAYIEIFSKNPPATFIDLGCNSGLFPCFLTHLANGAPLSGLCVDANLEQLELAKKSASLNGWSHIHFRHGVAGSAHVNDSQSEFFLHPTSLGSSQFAYEQSASGQAPAWKRILVSNLHVEEIWNQLFGPMQQCDCLKIDIEGSEMNFLRQETSLLSRVNSILIEWHSWTCTKSEVVNFLADQHFALHREIENTPRHGVLFFRRDNLTNSYV